MIVNFKEAKLNYDLQKNLKKLRKIYNDIEINCYNLPEYIVFIFYKDVYKKMIRIPYIELESYNIEEFLKFHLNNFCYLIYKKREEEINKE